MPFAGSDLKIVGGVLGSGLIIAGVAVMTFGVVYKSERTVKRFWNSIPDIDLGKSVVFLHPLSSFCFV